MASLLTPKRECTSCSQSDGVCNGEVVTFTTAKTREVFVRCGPMIEAGTPAEQAAKFYHCLPRLLATANVQPSDVIIERVFFRDIEADFETFQKIRTEAYAEWGVTGDQLPAASYINQPPCHGEHAIELQLQAIVGLADSDFEVESFAEIAPRTTKKVLRIGDHRHLFIANINGSNPDGSLPSDFRQQSDQMFAKSIPMLQEHGIGFRDVLRTWCYLDEIDRDYAEFNLSRNAFFNEHNVKRLPASTGIRAGLYPPTAMCGYDLYALLDTDGADVEVMHTPTLNEADEYGSAFSRGMKVGLPDKTVLYISGTASVDEKGDTVHLDDIRQQIERMLLNVQELLRPHNSSFDDVVQVITYLKRADYLPVFLEIWKKWKLNGLPNTIVEAGVCRPDLLCELEAIAMTPKA